MPEGHPIIPTKRHIRDLPSEDDPTVTSKELEQAAVKGLETTAGIMPGEFKDLCECDCECHTNPNVTDFVPCCEIAVCGMNIKRRLMNQHKKECEECARLDNNPAA